MDMVTIHKNNGMNFIKIINNVKIINQQTSFANLFNISKYQATKLAALLQNVEMMDKMLVDYSESSGSALSESNKSANNLE